MSFLKKDKDLSQEETMIEKFTALSDQISDLTVDIILIKNSVARIESRQDKDNKELKAEYVDHKDLAIKILSLKNWIFVSIITFLGGTFLTIINMAMMLFKNLH